MRQGVVSNLGLIALAVLTAALTQLAHVELDAVPLPQSHRIEETLPSVEALKLTCLGYRSLAADYYWLKAINHFGNGAMNRYHYPNLAPLLERVVALDPYYAEAYFVAGTVLTLRGMDPSIPVRILKRGMHYRPDDWRIPFLLGFNSYFFLHDYAAGARYLADAAKHPKAPKIAGPLATRLAAQAGEPEVGLQMIDTLEATTHDPKLRKTYEQRRKDLELELYLEWLNQAAAHYRAQTGHPPQYLHDLVGPGLLQRLPPAPLGGHYYINAHGKVDTTSPRLRLYKAAKGRKLFALCRSTTWP